VIGVEVYHVFLSELIQALGIGVSCRIISIYSNKQSEYTLLALQEII
jgi:hypothetical protein